MGRLTWGCNRALPEGVRVAWGARWIAPADQLYDRCSWASDGGDGAGDRVGALTAWLNGDADRKGALARAQEEARARSLGVAFPGSEEMMRLYEDEQGIIVGSPQGSYAYVYVAAWLFADVPAREGRHPRGVEVTETGRVLTDADMERLADEAERGHPEVAGDGR